MWWKPETDDERRLAELLPRLQRQFVEHITRELVLGVGAFFRDGPPLVPLLLVNGLGTDSLNQIVDKSKLPQSILKELQDWKLPDDTRFFLVTPTEPASSHIPISTASGAAIRCQSTRARATLGAALTRNPSSTPRSTAFLTVGHLAPTGSVIELISQNWLTPTQYSVIGHVSHSTDPTRNPGQPDYDVAVVDLNPGVTLSQMAHAGVARIQSPINLPLLSTLYGAVSGMVTQAAIIGSLNAYGSGAGIWKNSWLVLPSGVISQGDSGGMLVTGGTNKVVGMIVGGSRVPNSTVYMAQYAHDMESLEKDVLIPTGYSIV